jgi:hypothetical protein
VTRENWRQRSRSEPLGGERYCVRFTVDAALHAQLQELQALMRHQIPDGDLGKILARAVPLLLKQVRKRKFGEGSAPKSKKPGSEPVSRSIPPATRPGGSRSSATSTISIRLVVISERRLWPGSRSGRRRRCPRSGRRGEAMGRHLPPQLD